MPTKRTRRGHHGETLTIAQQCFLADEPLPHGADLHMKMQDIWLRQSKKRDGATGHMPDGSTHPATLWRDYGREILCERRRAGIRGKHPLLERYGRPTRRATAT